MTKMSTEFGKNKKLTIVSIDDKSVMVEAQFNPNEIEIKRDVPWSPHPTPNAGGADDGMQLEFSGGKGRTLSVALLFDGFEKNESVQPMVNTLEQMATVIDATAKDDKKRRPHHVAVIYGAAMLEDGKPPKTFQGVITSLSTKYSMFDVDGKPVRATVTVSLQEASRLSMKK